MKVTILGCGASAGVPTIGCKCDVCTSDNPKNHRKRCSIIVDNRDTRILIDTSPDLHSQAIENDITTVSAILYTHAHADHTQGIAETRSFNANANKEIDVYFDRKTMDELTERFPYVFELKDPKLGWNKPYLIAHEIEAGKEFYVKDTKILPIAQNHGKCGKSLGFRFGDFAYSTDVTSMDDSSFEALNGLDTWIVGCISYREFPTHAGLTTVLEWINRIKPKQTFLTHMWHEFDYETLKNELPDGVFPASDNMVIDIPS